MLKEAPFTIGIVDSHETGVRELHFTFLDSFRSVSLEQRSQIFQIYIKGLEKAINKLDDGNSERVGMETIFQISSELLPHIEADEIPLHNPIVVEIGQDDSMVNLLNGIPIQ